MHSQVWGRIIRGQEHEGYVVLNGAKVADITPATKVGLPPTESRGMRAGRAAQGMVPPVTEERKGIVAVKEIDRAVNEITKRRDVGLPDSSMMGEKMGGAPAARGCSIEREREDGCFWESSSCPGLLD